MPKGVACVLMGYAPFQKGYNVINIATQHTFVTRDVRFHENIFPYNSTSPKLYIQPLHVSVPHAQPDYNVYDDDVFITDLLIHLRHFILLRHIVILIRSQMILI